ncbi:serendipity locus protein alpha [Galleria mellonella]|uniref:Serendipity locus protein alpha n=1 Tax=Galleria mellonella TaxID=7137 RepID=A0A6J1WMK8_GALME|nr:serendipity locus protein alpha [Galleria mellonella]
MNTIENYYFSKFSVLQTSIKLNKMESSDLELLEFLPMPLDPRFAVKHIVGILLTKFRPISLRIHKKILSFDNDLEDDNINRIQDMVALCTSQIKKNVLNLMDIFKVEHCQQLSLQESRQFTIERLTWCMNRLLLIEQQLSSNVTTNDENNESVFIIPMHFVNWIDYTFETLAKLSETIYRTDYKKTENIYQQWKDDVVDSVTVLYKCIDELLLSAMTLCRHCITSDQYIVKARCQVVLRETKALFSELVEETPSETFKVTPDTLKTQIKPSNVNVLIDVLKDVLYVLETNTNTALLALLVYCFSNSKTPVEILREHFNKNTKGGCSCTHSLGNVSDECSVIKEFDLYNERLMQIGLFAISCSSDQNRILILRSGLASLEALDPHLVPAVMVSANSNHSIMLMRIWQQEVQEIRDNVFLIVDPAAFTEKSKQIMHQVLLELIKANCYINSKVCSIINIGCTLHEFFSVYNKYEPNALMHREELLPLLADLEKVQMECKIVSNILSSGDDFIYEIKKSIPNKELSLEQLLKRLKLLYTMVNRINELLHPKENEDQLFADDFCEYDPPRNKNVTHSILPINTNTYVNSPRKHNNLTRSVFARTTNVRLSRNNFILSKLTKHLKDKTGYRRDVLSYSARLDELLNEENNCNANNTEKNKLLSIREPSVLFMSPLKSRSSLRRAVLNSHYKLQHLKKTENKTSLDKSVTEKENLFDETTSLQITDVLNEINDLTNVLSTTKDICKKRATSNIEYNNEKSILTLKVNEQNTATSKYIWNIPVNSNIEERSLDENEMISNVSNLTQPSDVTTPERISDLDLVESKLNSLKCMQFETSL